VNSFYPKGKKEKLPHSGHFNSAPARTYNWHLKDHIPKVYHTLHHPQFRKHTCSQHSPSEDLERAI